MNNFTISTSYWHQQEDGKLKCEVCPRACALSEGQRGMCFVRARENNEIVLTSYGRSSGFCVDPVEKKPLNHFLPGTPILSFGTAGCNLTCKFCQNWDISKSRQIDSLLDEASPEILAGVAKQLNCRSVAFTYNDPVIFMEYAIDVAKACHDVGVKSVAVTAGYICDRPRREFFRYIDAANVDLKAFTDEFYHNICSARLQPVLDTLLYIKHETEVWLEVTTLLIPGKNDSAEEIDAQTKWLVANLGPDVPLHFTAFHPDYRMREVPHTPQHTLTSAREIAMQNGLHFVYTGNIHDEVGGSTYCPSCRKKVIGRDWYEITSYHLGDYGACGFCGFPISGVFDGPAGDWGRKRTPVSLRDIGVP